MTEVHALDLDGHDYRGTVSWAPSPAEAEHVVLLTPAAPSNGATRLVATLAEGERRTWTARIAGTEPRVLDGDLEEAAIHAAVTFIRQARLTSLPGATVTYVDGDGWTDAPRCSCGNDVIGDGFDGIRDERRRASQFVCRTCFAVYPEPPEIDGRVPDPALRLAADYNLADRR